MKKLIYLFLSILIGRAFLLSQNYWHFINNNPPQIKVYSSCLIGNTVYFWCDGNIVFKTPDAGNSFEVLSPYGPVNNTSLGCCDRHGIAFADSFIGYITDIGHGEFRTVDGGRIWEKTANVGSNISLVEFGSASIGWKLGEGGLYKTTDAGETWKLLSASFFGAGIFSNIYALDEQNVWVLKSYYYGRDVEGSIWYSLDGGSSWNQLQTGLISSDENQIEYYDILIKSSGEGIAIGRIFRPSLNERKSFIQKTNDFGVTWTTRELPDNYFNDVLSIDDSTWIILGNTGFYPDNSIVQLRSDDNGLSWNESNPSTSTGYNLLYSSIYVPGFESILVATVSGIYKSVDKGRTYLKVNTDYDIYVKDVTLDNKPLSTPSQTIVAESNNRSYLISKNAGHSWKLKEIPGELGNQLWEVKISEEVIYIVVDQTRLYKSIDGGISWTRINVPVWYALRALEVFDQNTLVLQGYMNLFTSFDGGTTWLTAPFPNNFWLNESVMLDLNQVVAIGSFYNSGNQGIFYKSFDNGFNWRIEDTPHEIKQISMINDRVGFALNNYNFYKTTDAGDSWKVIKRSNDYSEAFSAFCFKDALHGLLHSGEIFLKTENGGYSWQNIELNFPFSYVEKMVVNNKGDYFAVSGGNLLVSFSDDSIKNEVDTASANKFLINKYLLLQNIPNPFNPETRIPVFVFQEGSVTLKIYDVLGKEVRNLFSGYLNSGKHYFRWDGSDNFGFKLSSGIYFYRMTDSRGASSVKRMILMR
jgi:photosystem II stability/assembly factor-like uncharacterized protein